MLSVFFCRDEMECKGVGCCGNSYPMDRVFLAKLDLLRSEYDSEIYISSGFRCNKHNKKVGGSPNSWHTRGRAVDCFTIDVADLEKVHKIAKTMFREVILNIKSGFIHIADE
jgi:uncharacterized protein YcbK (DUF882 family)